MGTLAPKTSYVGNLVFHERGDLDDSAIRRAYEIESDQTSFTRAAPAPSVTVVVPSFNQGRYLRVCLDSLLDQRYPDLEILVFDGGSTDESVEILKSYGEAITWVSEPDEGQSDAIRKGFGQARGEWLTWLNSDDYQANDSLAALAECAAANPDAELAVGQAHYADADGNYLRPYPTLPVSGPGIDVRREVFEKGYVAQPSIYFRKAAYERIGGINPDLYYVMDYDLWARFALAGCRFAAINADISGNRLHAETKTAQILPLYAEQAATQRRLFGRVSPYLVQAVSDHIYHLFHDKGTGERNHLWLRLLYFKAFWLCFNARRPVYCLKGFVILHMCKGSPLVGNRLTYRGLLYVLGERALYTLYLIARPVVGPLWRDIKRRRRRRLGQSG